MSIETIVAENTAAIKELTAAILAGNEGREKVLAAAQAATEKAAPKAKPKAEPAETPKEDKKAVAETETDGPTVEDVNDAIKKYVGGTERTEERDARKAKVLGVLTKFSPEGTAKPNGGTLAEDKRGAFIKTVDKWIEAGDITTPPAESEEDDLLGED